VRGSSLPFRTAWDRYKKTEKEVKYMGKWGRLKNTKDSIEKNPKGWSAQRLKSSPEEKRGK